MTKFEKAFAEALANRGFRTAPPIRIGKGVTRRMFIERGSMTRRDMPSAVLAVLRRG